VWVASRWLNCVRRACWGYAGGPSVTTSGSGGCLPWAVSAEGGDAGSDPGAGIFDLKLVRTGCEVL
jgi:hypothetical protein